MIKIDIFSGFLGAGKTTLIKKLISEAFAGEKLVVIENEFGDIGIDGGFLEEAGIQITEMNSGCICCSLVGDFGKALAEVIETYAPERILIEPSGVGKLSDVIKAVKDLGLTNITLNSATAVVDAKKCKMYMKNFGEFFNNQIESAGTIVLSHTKGLSEEKLAKTVELIRAHNADAQIVTTDWDVLSGAQILSAMEKTDTLSDALKALENEEICPECGGHHHHHHHDDDCGCDGHHHHHDHHHHDDDCDCECHGHEHHHHHDDHCHHDHEEHHHEHHHDHGEECTCGCHDHHGHHHADEVFTSWGKETAHSYTREELLSALSALENEAEYGMVLRAKGIVCGDGCWYHFDYTPGEGDVREGGAATTGRLCVIGSGINEEKLEVLFK
ncbi:MAG: GTP-binding protein [Ruminococcaceae bacterium]|nr:GTP-binding protein [Oscillospiraceae bacterium]